MPVPPVGENAVMLCDWRGRCTWASTGNLPVTIGKFVWENLSAASQEDAKVAIGRVVALRETRQLEVADQQGIRFRGWLWPLDSPDVAVCILAVRIPRNLAKPRSENVSASNPMEFQQRHSREPLHIRPSRPLSTWSSRLVSF